MTTFYDFSIPKAAKEAKLKELTAGLPAEVQAGIQKLADDKKQAIEAAFAKAAANLDDNGIKLLDQIKSIMQNPDLSTIEVCNQVHRLTSQADPAIVEQLKMPQISCDQLKGEVDVGKILGAVAAKDN
uniref:Uncharacterized protein n=1 Tax=Ditylenchus dipsaci TaxID=166011 RepID=A0A915DH31_9BILA